MSQPYVFWHSEPVRPDETLVISGEDFESSAVLEIAEQNGKWLAVKPLQIGKQSLKAVIPPEFKFGTWRGRVKQGKDVSEEFTVNAPEIWWKQGDGGVDAAYP